MAWIVEDRRRVIEETGKPYLTDELKAHLRDTFFPRYPTKRAVLLPALHAVQHEYGYIPPRALDEVAEFLEVSSAEALDTASFYEEYWLRPKGQYLIGVCRSLSCEICGSCDLTDALRRKLKVELGETTADGRFTLIELECLGACGTAPVALVNEVLHENLTPASFNQLIADLPADPHAYQDPTMTWPQNGHPHPPATPTAPVTPTAALTAAPSLPPTPIAPPPATAATIAPAATNATAQNSPQSIPASPAGPFHNKGECDDNGPRVLQPPQQP